MFNGGAMELAITNMFIKDLQFFGIMRSSIIKDFHDVKLKIEFYKILTSDRQLVEMVEKSCLEDHVNPNALKLVSSELVYTKVLNYNDSEYFRNYLSFVCSRNLYEDRKTNKVWIIEFKFPMSGDVNFFRINLTTDQVTRLYSQINSFYSNFMMFSAIAKQHIVDQPKEEVKSKKVTEYAKDVENTAIEIETQKISQLAPQTKERTELDDIFELCLNSSIKSSLIHYTFNYFKYFTKDHCKIQTNQKGQVQYLLPLLVPGNLNFDDSYFDSLIQANGSVSSSNVIFAIKKILNNLLLNHGKYHEKPMMIMMMSYLLFVYMLKYLNDTNKDSFRTHFRRLICEADAQSGILRSLIATSTFKDFTNKIFFKIVNICPAEAANDQEIERINALSQEYKHLIPVSPEEFVEKVLNKANNSNDDKMPKFFKLSNKKVLDISKYISSKEQSTSYSTILFDPDQTLDQDKNEDKLYSILNYELNNGTRVISKAYQYLINYIKNPSSLLLLKETDLPKEIINLFDILSKKILNPSVISKDNVNTLNYYNVLVENLPNSHQFNHITMMYIIFQIMIPYHYDIYHTNQFTDCLL
jgi:hypothetical protein